MTMFTPNAPPSQYPAITLVNPDGSAYNAAATIPANTYVSAANELTAGESTLPRIPLTAGSGTGSGTLRLTYFTAKKSENTASLRLISGTTAGVTLTLARAGIYSVAGNGDLTLLGAITNDTTLFTAVSTRYTRAITAPFARVAGNRYALGVIITGTTMPTLQGQVYTMADEASEAPRIAGSLTGQTDLPASITAGTILNAAAQLHYAVLLP